jgi:hypothetical protein
MTQEPNDIHDICNIRACRFLGMIPPCVAALAFMLSVISNFWCESVKFVADTDAALLLGTFIDYTPQDIQLGPWSRQDTVLVSVNSGTGTRYFVRQVCRPYPENGNSIHVDGAWKTVRAFSILALVLGGFLTAFLFLNNCVYYFSARGWRSIAIQFMVTVTVCQGLTLLLLQSTACSDNPLLFLPPPSLDGNIVTQEIWRQFVLAVYGDEECTWSSGMTCNVLALIGWFATGVLMLVIGAPERTPVEPPQTQQVTYERTVNPDGSVTVTQTNVIKGTAIVAPPPEEPANSSNVA